MTVTERSSALAPFRIRSYRFQWPADVLTSWAFEMEFLILGWYILVETGSVVMLTLFGSLMYLGTLVAPMFGVFGDRIGHRNLLAGMRAAYALLATTMMTLALTGLINPLYVFVIAAIFGTIRPSDLGVRGALVASTMPPAYLVSAMSVSRTTMDSARIAGALTGAGMFAALGMGPAYIVIASLYVASTILTLCISPSSETRSPDEAGAAYASSSPWRDLSDGIAYIWNTPRLQAAMWIAFLVNLTAYPFTSNLLPYIAREVHQTDQTGLGYLSASFALGALAASMVLSHLSGVKLARVMIIATAAWYAMLMVFAQAQSLPTAIACLMLTGFAQSLSMIALAVILMRTASERFRGRVMGVRMMAIYSLPVGLLVAGPLIELMGFMPTATLYAAIGLSFTLLIAVRWREDLWRPLAPANTM
ncbi:arabinose ABC transporter permease [Afipia sp. P52-10]|nr:MFS transporter [Afipia sp. P52-10]ETR74809.1 arabinose ABC transporter permease [Afipia sp. P52-10]